MHKKSLIKFLVLRYLRIDKTQPFITITALLAFFGVSIGLMVLIVAMAIMNGFDKEFERKLFTMNYPLTILPFSKGSLHEDDLQKIQDKFPHLLFSPYISTQAIVKYGGRLEGIILFGVDFKREKKINSVINEALKDKEIPDFNLLIGKGIKEMFLLPLESKMTLVFTQNSPNGLSLMPRMKRFSYKAEFSSGLLAYDKAYTFTTLESLRKILEYKKQTYDGIHVYSKDPFKDIELLKNALPKHLKVVGWWQQNGNFFSALQLEKRALFIVLMLIVLVASLNIISSLLMTVMNRRKEIALLFSLGAYEKEVKNTFLYLGFIVGGGGIIFGTILGFLGIFLLGNFDIISLPADVYGTTKLPMELSLKDFLSILLGAICIVVFSSYYPAKKATKIDALKTLRNE